MDNFITLALYFIFYATLGWCIEVVYYTTISGKFINRGFLNGPTCPVYGVSFVIVILLLTPLQSNLPVLFFGSMLLATTMELLTGFVLEKIFHEKWWDYANEPFNLGGYICLKFSLLWGIACTFVMRIVHPLYDQMISHIPKTVKIIIICVVAGCYLSDIIITVIELRKLRAEMSVLREITLRLRGFSDYVGEELSDKTLDIMEASDKARDEMKERTDKVRDEMKERTDKVRDEMKERTDKVRDEVKERTDKVREDLEELSARYKKLVAKNSFTRSRINKAFPRLHIEKSYRSFGISLKRIREEYEKLVDKHKNSESEHRSKLKNNDDND